MSKKSKQHPNDWGQIKRILGYLLRYRLVFFCGLLVTIVFGATETLVPWIMYLLLNPEQVDDWIPVESMPVALPIMLISLFILRGVLGFMRTYWRGWMHQTMARDLRLELADKLVRLPKSYHDRETSGILLSRLMHFIDQMLASVVIMLVNLMQDIARLAGYLATMFAIEWRFTLVALVTLPITIVIIGWISRRIRRYTGRQVEALSDLSGSFGDTIQGHVVVKTYGGQKRELNRLSRELAQLRGIGLRQAAAIALNLPLSQLFIASSLALILGLLASALFKGSLTEGEVGTFIFAMVLLPLPLRSLAQVGEQLQISLAAAKQVFDLLDTEQEPIDGDYAPAACDGDIEFKGVDFSYPTGNDTKVLQGVDISINKGERIALVGPSGSGKSTLTNLLLGFYQPTAGTIYVDGIDIKDWSLDSLRSCIGVVTQDVVLFNTSVEENVAYPHTGDEIDQERLQKALRDAQVKDIVADLPDGLRTIIGERGLTLSGGERQRLSIARAFYKDAPILILDEATSALDSQTEDAIQTALRRLLEDRTALIIAHRMATVEIADRIVVLDEGQVNAVGTHAELLESSTLYHRLYEMQRLQD